MKQRNTRYLLSDMQPGERFYIANDRHKRVLQLYSVQPFEQIKVKGFWKRMANCLPDGTTTPERHLANTYVIFLRTV